ncbi:hypothetical protein ACDI96_02250 [Citrobacter telavivensis]
MNIKICALGWCLAIAVVSLLSGCAGKANHPQCQSLRNRAYGEQLGAAASGRYIDQVEANIADRQYERCEELFDLAQYQAQEQKTTIVVQQTTSEPRSSSKLQYASLKGLVDCEKSIVSTASEELLKEGASSAYQCEREIDRRISSGAVSRDVVDRMLNQG